GVQPDAIAGEVEEGEALDSARPATYGQAVGREAGLGAVQADDRGAGVARGRGAVQDGDIGKGREGRAGYGDRTGARGELDQVGSAGRAGVDQVGEIDGIAQRARCIGVVQAGDRVRGGRYTAILQRLQARPEPAGTEVH